MNHWCGRLAVVLCLLCGIAFSAPRELEEKDFTVEFVQQCRTRAVAGDAEGQALYGRALYNGWGIGRDCDAGVEWFERAAGQGNALAQRLLGRVCEIKAKNVSGAIATTEWYRKAADWYQKAAEQGDAESQCKLGVFYNFGYGVMRDFNAAYRWFQKAAEQGYPEALRRMGRCFEYGFGVEKDMSKAAEWYGKAADTGDEGAIDWVRRHEALMARGNEPKTDQKAVLLARAKEHENETFVLGGFYVGMPLADAQHLLKIYHPEYQILHGANLDDGWNKSEAMSGTGVWLEKNEQPFCRTDEKGNVRLFNFTADMLKDLFSYKSSSSQGWAEEFAREHGARIVHESFYETGNCEYGCVALSQEKFVLKTSFSVKITYFGKMKSEETCFDNGILTIGLLKDFAKGFLLGHIHGEAAREGTLRIEAK